MMVKAAETVEAAIGVLSRASQHSPVAIVVVIGEITRVGIVQQGGEIGTMVEAGFLRVRMA